MRRGSAGNAPHLAKRLIKIERLAACGVGTLADMSNRGAIAFFIGLLLLACAALPGHAQIAGAGAGKAGAKSGDGNNLPTVRLTARQLGVGGRARHGDWFGLQIVLAGATSPREVLVKLNIPDVDGDITEYQSQLTITPGAEQQVWLYGRLPASAATSLLVTAFDLETTASGDRKVVGQAARTEVSLSTALPGTTGTIGIVGRSMLGLELYGIRQTTYDSLHTGHEGTDLISGLQTGDLPDRWMGYGGIDVLIWGTADPTVRPSNLSPPQAAALREWVSRGGHLVVVLPTIATDWFGPSNPIGGMMPAVTVQRNERADLSAIATLVGGRLSEKDAKPRVREASVNFLIPDAMGVLGEATTILQDDQARGIAVRRLLGAGMVTMIGLDLASPAILATGGVQADVFWHRLLGRRGELRTSEELATLARERKGFFEQRAPIPMDGFIADQINKKGAAALGVILALVVFGLYWAIAGPLGFMVLKRSGKSHLAWVAYLAVAGVFTAVAWGGASLIKPQKIEVTHLTVLDVVSGQPIQRARMWASVLLPRYGSTSVSVPEDSEGRNFVTALSPWDSAGSASSGGFPDTRGYAIDARLPNKTDFPSRSTTKPVRVDWAGSVAWKLPVPIGEPEGPGKPPRLRPVERKTPGMSGTSVGIDGQLKNELPADLTDVLVLISRQQAPSGISRSQRLIFQGEAYVVPFWKKDSVLDLGDVTTPTQVSGTGGGGSGPMLTSIQSYLDRISPSSRGLGIDPRSLREDELPDRIAAMSFFSCLQPPNWQTAESHPLYRRDNWHGLDLSAYLTQPCVIIIGHMGSRANPHPTPIPLQIDGQPAPSKGRTVFRWIYPLPADPPRVERPEVERPAGISVPKLDGGAAVPGG